LGTANFEYQAVEGIYEHAALLVKEGKTKAEVRDDLKLRGLNDERASIVVDNIIELRAKARQEAGQLNMFYGALLCIGGIGATVLTYPVAASLSGGAHHLIAGGAITLGAIQLFRGLAQASRKGKAVSIIPDSAVAIDSVRKVQPVHSEVTP